MKIHPTDLLPGDVLANGCVVIQTPITKSPSLNRWITPVNNPGYGPTSVLLKDGPVEVVNRG